MKIKNITYPAWVFRYASKKKNFEIIRIYKRGGIDNGAFFYDLRVSSLYYSPSALRKTSLNPYLTYSTILKDYHDISELSEEYKERLIQSVFEKGIQ